MGSGRRAQKPIMVDESNHAHLTEMKGGLGRGPASYNDVIRWLLEYARMTGYVAPPGLGEERLKWVYDGTGRGPREVYEERVRAREEELGRGMALGERVNFAQWHGYNERQMMVLGWVLGDTYEGAREEVGEMEAQWMSINVR